VHDLTPRRRRLAGASLALGMVLATSGIFLSPAKAAGPAVFPAGYDSYLQENQRGIAAAEKETGAACPTDAAVAGLTAWHFVLTGGSHDYVSLDVAFVLGGTNVTLSGLTPKTTADWATFDPNAHFIASPDTKHAYVYTSGTGSVRDAASQNSPDSTGPQIVLSHTCAGSGSTTTTTEGTTTTTEGTTTTTEGTTTTTEGTTTTTEGTTTTTEGTTTTTEGTTTTTEGTTTTTEGTTTTEVSPSSTEQGPTTTAGEPTTSETVAGEQVTRALPTTGSSTTLPLVVAGGALILGGLVTLRLGREQAAR
jgi:LPXTG-motif cell wall-anchored protein